MKELLVKTNDRDLLDRTLIQLGGLVGQHPSENGVYPVRSVNGDLGFLKFSIEHQGYGEVVGEREV